MKRMIIACLLIAGIAAAGCATTKPAKDLNRLSKKDLNKLSKKEIAAYNANPENTDKIVCTTEKPVGSIIPVRVCHKESKIRDRRLQDQQAMQGVLRSAPPPPSNH